MKRYLSIFVMSLVMAASFTVLATTSSAQDRDCDSNGRRYNNGRYNSRSYYNDARYYNDDDRNYYKRPNVYRRHRKAFNIGIGTGVGALVGGLLGGKKGVVIGGLAGAGGGALFTHYQRPKNRVRYYRRY